MPIAGKVMPRPRGDYNKAAVYQILDVVKHKEKSWICKKNDVVGVDPTVYNYDTWQELFGKVVDADTFAGHEYSYFASSESVSLLGQAVNGRIDEVVSGTNEALNSTNNSIILLSQYVDMLENVKEVTIPASGWSSSAPYVQVVNLEGVKANSKYEVFIYYPDTINSSNAESYCESFNYINKYEALADGKITCTAFYEKPTMDVVVSIKGVGN